MSGKTNFSAEQLSTTISTTGELNIRLWQWRSQMTQTARKWKAIGRGCG